MQHEPDPQPLPYPPARTVDQVDTFFGTAVHDPYRWMEEPDTPELESWIAAENALTEGWLAAVPGRDALLRRLEELNRFERVSAPRREGGREFFARNTGLQNQAVLWWREGADGEPRVLLDPNTLAADGTVALGTSSVSRDGTLLAYALGEAGSDVQTVRVRVVATGEDLPDRIAYVKFSALSWAHDGSGFYYSSFGLPPVEAEAETLKRVSTHHAVWFHRLGTAQAEDAVIFRRDDDGEMLCGAHVSEDGAWLALAQGKGHTNALTLRSLRDPAATADLALAPVADASYDFITSRGSTVWLFTNKDAARGRIVAVDCNHTAPEHWRTIVPEGEHALESVSSAGDTLLLTWLVDARNEVEVRGLDGALLHRVALPGVGLVGVGSAHQDEHEVYFSFTNYTTPATIYKLDVRTGAATLHHAPALRFDPALYETRQVFATSKDGTRVPLFVTARKGLTLDGSHPTLLYGYGGFSVSLGPAYSSSRLLWLELGGVYAESILRGGGEYGEAWHQAGTKLRKQNVFDDFLACAEWLLANGYTRADKLATNGGSNGGLLVAACALQRPELFGTVVPQVGVLDMLRFDRFTIGYAWKPDYGSPTEDEAEFRALLAYSPLHTVRAGVRYPPMLLCTADHDDRVYPAHSFKFAAAMQAAAGVTSGSGPVLIRVEQRAGHGAGMPLSKQMQQTVDVYAFLLRALGMPTRAG